MIIAASALAALALQGAPTQGTTTQTPPPAQTVTAQPAAKPASTVLYTNEQLGLAFDHPKDWKQSKIRVKNEVKFDIKDPHTWRPPKYDTTTKFLMPLPGVDERGVLEIFSAQFFADQDIWQASQRDINQQISTMNHGADKRTVLRQWTDELLGVPLLMTKIEDNNKGEKRIIETGLMYSATPRKLIFRVSASPENFDKAEYAWQQVMQTMRTTDGRLPSAEDPNRKLTAADMVPGGFHKVIWTAPAPPPLTPIKSPVVNDATAGGKTVHLRSPNGWKVQKNLDGSFTLTSAELPGPVTVTVASDLDSEPPDRALIRSAGRTLGAFSVVDKREESGPNPTHAQMKSYTIFRRGYADAAKSKPEFSFDATAWITPSATSGDIYYILSWTGSDANWERDKKALEGLVDVLGIDPES